MEAEAQIAFVYREKMHVLEAAVPPFQALDALRMTPANFSFPTLLII